ncbi:MAG TPA: DMT family transporter [Prolixibacteraceae bacterium]|nr:DMT family transporter [Prolixibacteraceae bacterium]
MWALFAVASAVFLGTYDVFKKLSLNSNAVLPVLFFSTLTSAVIFLPFILVSNFYPDLLNNGIFFIPTVPITQHAYFFLKAVIVTSSWIFAFFAIKHLPLTIVSPIRATGPIWILFGAIVIFSEHLSIIQWIGIAVTLLFFYFFSFAGKLEGIHFATNKWILFLIAGTLLGSASGLYDKFLIRNFDRMAVQAWSSIYQVGLLLPVILFLWYPKRMENTPFQWRWSIPMIGLFLVIADFLYFYAISMDGSLISVISALRRSGVIISFALGGILFHEKNIRRKGWLLLGILTGVLILLFGS